MCRVAALPEPQLPDLYRLLREVRAWDVEAAAGVGGCTGGIDGDRRSGGGCRGGDVVLEHLAEGPVVGVDRRMRSPS